MLSLEEAALEPAHRQAGLAPLITSMTKELKYKGLATNFDSGIDWEGWLISSAFYTEDGKGGERAAGEKRAPHKKRVLISSVSL